MTACSLFKTLNAKVDLRPSKNECYDFYIHGAGVVLRELQQDLWSTSTLSAIRAADLPEVVVVYKIVLDEPSNRLYYCWTEVDSNEFTIIYSSRLEIKAAVDPPFCAALSDWLGGPTRSRFSRAHHEGGNRWRIVRVHSRHAPLDAMPALHASAHRVLLPPPFMN